MPWVERVLGWQEPKERSNGKGKDGMEAQVLRTLTLWVEECWCMSRRELFSLVDFDFWRERHSPSRPATPGSGAEGRR